MSNNTSAVEDEYNLSYQVSYTRENYPRCSYLACEYRNAPERLLVAEEARQTSRPFSIDTVLEQHCYRTLLYSVVRVICPLLLAVLCSAVRDIARQRKRGNVSKIQTLVDEL